MRTWCQSGIGMVSLILLATGSLCAADPTPGKQVPQAMSSAAVDAKLGYWLFLPKDYGTDDRKWPVLLFLHGAGERGDNLDLVKVHGPPKLVDQRPDFPFIVVSPQCAKDHWWPGDVQQHLLAELLDHVLTQYRADPRRVVCTGLSMGGFGTWALVARHPQRFAAAVPICGGGDPALASRLQHVPFWVFHGAKDLVVPLKLSEEMVTAVTNAGGKAKLTVYPEAGHDSWTETYNNQAVYDWLLEQRRETPAALPTADAQASFVEAAFVDLKLGKPEDKNTFAAQVYLTSSRERAAAIHERVSSKRQALTQAIVDWVNAQPTADLVGNAGRERTRAEAKKLAQQIVFGGSTDLAFDVAFDLYFVRHNGRLVLEAK